MRYKTGWKCDLLSLTGNLGVSADFIWDALSDHTSFLRVHIILIWD